ncbi:MAG TPA: carboxylating nicotinate-nucleotide diphosphorylase [Xanthomonadales bacterium]|nr:carboxylating nicotinate-nucleotide diphosphorylase [Xanthomonadales bacterium]
MTRRVDPPDASVVADDVARALAEDVRGGDLTAQLLPFEKRGRAHVVAKEPCVLAGAPWFDACFASFDRPPVVQWHYADGDTVPAGAVVCRIEGQARAIVTGERTALNFLQTLSATATQTAAFVAAVAGTRTRVLDTRKTLPGLRIAQKYAVRCGGGMNHRMGLWDAVLVKENHIAAAGSIAAAIASARAIAPGVLLEVEVESLDELREALAAKPDRIMIDDFSPADMRAAVAIAAGRCALEVSGGVSLETIGAIAKTGVDYVSIGALTKHVRAIDFSLRMDG